MAIWHSALQQAFPLSPITRATFLEMRRGLASPQCVLYTDEVTRVRARLDAALEGRMSVGSALIDIIDVYRENLIGSMPLQGTVLSGEAVWEERARHSLRPLRQRVDPDSDFLLSPFWRDDASIFREKRRYGGPTLFIAEDARRIVSATMDLNRYDVADGKLILGLILFVAQRWGWQVQWCAESSLQDDYFAMFTQRIRPVLVGPTRVDIHGRMVHPMIALYHDLLHLSQVARRYPLGDEAPYRAQIALYHQVKSALDAAGLDDSEWFGYGPRIGFTLLSLLCEGAALDDARFELCEDFDIVIRALRAQEKVAAAS